MAGYIDMPGGVGFVQTLLPSMVKVIFSLVTFTSTRVSEQRPQCSKRHSIKAGDHCAELLKLVD